MKKQITYIVYAIVSFSIIFVMGKTLVTIATILPAEHSSTVDTTSSFSEVIRTSQQPTAKILHDEEAQDALHGSAPQETFSGELFPDLREVRPDTDEQLRAKGYE